MSKSMRAYASLLAHLGAFFWIGCSSDSITSALDAEVQLAKALCQRQVDCGEISPGELGACGQAADDLRNHPSIPDYAEAVASGRAGFDTSRAAACVNAVKQAVCEQTLSAEASCLYALSPQVADRGACKNAFECKSGVCSAKSSGCAGTCAATIPTGGACTSNTSSGAAVCAPTDHCDSTSRTCMPRKSAGSSCKASDECLVETFCVGYQTGAGTCKAFAGLGQPCDGIFTTTCSYDLFCDGSQKPSSCQTPRGAGSACQFDGACQAGLICLGPKSGGQFMGSCSPVLDTGASCDPANDFSSGCPADETCDPQMRKCVSRPGSGQACAGALLCSENNYCAAGTCTPQAPLGASCDPTATFPCRQGLCDSATKTCALQC